MVRLAVPDTAARLTFAEPRTVLCTKEKALLPETLNRTMPLEGPRSCASDAEMTVAVNVTCSHLNKLRKHCATVSCAAALQPFLHRPLASILCDSYLLHPSGWHS